MNVNKMSVQKYLLSDKLLVEEQQLLYKLRTKTFNVKLNFSYMFKDDMKCRACEDICYVESVEHFTQNCEAFKEERDGKVLNVEHIYGPLEEQIPFIKTFKHIARKWNLIQELR